LGSFSGELLDKPMIVAGTKIDACQDQSRRDALRARAEADGRAYFEISAVTGEGVKPLLRALADRVRLARESAKAEAENAAALDDQP
jgi:GTP-binding protein